MGINNPHKIYRLQSTFHYLASPLPFFPLFFFLVVVFTAGLSLLAAQTKLLIPMDLKQTDHLKSVWDSVLAAGTQRRS